MVVYSVVANSGVGELWWMNPWWLTWRAKGATASDAGEQEAGRLPDPAGHLRHFDG
ncbi:hypothetical protein [Humibacter sp.]|uniref:hypothetical protein n=1 Tax=Humibacter sp. TaxID=1940291 RepID=UPI002C205FD9|nr:hypothetical protein [Humibacter sp.]HVX08485.1 hypothetical protein [Humibacter sp.]